MQKSRNQNSNTLSISKTTLQSSKKPSITQNTLNKPSASNASPDLRLRRHKPKRDKSPMPAKTDRETDRSCNPNKSSRSKSPLVNDLISQSLSKLQLQKQEKLKTEIEKIQKKREKELFLKKINRQIRKRNFRKNKKEPPQHSPSPINQTYTPSENPPLKPCKKQHSDTYKQRRDKIGLAFSKHPKNKKSKSPVVENNTRKVSDPMVVRYMKSKKQKEKISQVAYKLQEMIKENLRDKALLSLEKRNRFAKKKKKPSPQKQHLINLQSQHTQKVSNIYNLDSSHSSVDSPTFGHPDNHLIEKFNDILSEKHRQIDWKFIEYEHQVRESLKQFETLEIESKSWEAEEPRFKGKRPLELNIDEINEPKKINSIYHSSHSSGGLNSSDSSEMIKEISKEQNIEWTLDLSYQLDSKHYKSPSDQRLQEYLEEELQRTIEEFLEEEEIHRDLEEEKIEDFQEYFQQDDLLKEFETLRRREETSESSIENPLFLGGGFANEIYFDTEPLPYEEYDIKLFSFEGNPHEESDANLYSFEAEPPMKNKKEDIVVTNQPFLVENFKYLSPQVPETRDSAEKNETDLMKRKYNEDRDLIKERKKEQSQDKLKAEEPDLLKLGGVLSVKSNLGDDLSVQSKLGGVLPVQSKLGDDLSVQSKLGGVLPVQSKLGSVSSVQSKLGDVLPLQSKLGDVLPLQSEKTHSLNIEIANPLKIQQEESTNIATVKVENHKADKESIEEDTYQNTVFDEFLKKEISVYLSLVSFTKSEPEVNPSIDFIEDILENLLISLLSQENEILDIINTPIYPDPVEKLYILQNTEMGGLIRVPTLDLILLPENSYVLKNHFNKEDLYSKGMYMQMVFDCINEALNYIRPYGIEGIPSPWSRKEIKIVGESSISKVLEKVQDFVFRWWSVKVGLLVQGQDPEGQYVTKLREERMSAMLCSEAEANERQWLDYEDEETQVAIDIGDMILERLVLELIHINNKQD